MTNCSKADPATGDVLLDGMDILRWTLASKALQRYARNGMPVSDNYAYVVPHAELQASADTNLGLAGLWRPGVAASLLAAIYGGPHFLGWNTVFPTLAQKILWRCSTVLLTSVGALGGIAAICIRFFVGFKEKRKPSEMPTPEGHKGSFAEHASILSLAIFYLLASLYIVIESFIQLFYLSPNAYILPAWSNYFPHFS